MKTYSFEMGEQVLADAIARDFPRYKVVFDPILKFPLYQLQQIKDGSKKTTIKFKKDVLRLPRTELPSVDKETGRTIGIVTYSKVAVVEYSELTDEHARDDGSATLDDLKAVLSEAYGALQPEDVLTIHYFGKWIDIGQ